MRAKGLTKETICQLGIKDRGFDSFDVGDTVIVGIHIKEGEKQRVQHFEGDVIAVKKSGVSTTFTVRRIAADRIAVERIFPFYSPLIESIKFVRKGKICRAKLYYMRDRIGKAARIREQVMTKEEKERAKVRREQAAL